MSSFLRRFMEEGFSSDGPDVIQLVLDPKNLVENGFPAEAVNDPRRTPGEFWLKFHRIHFKNMVPLIDDTGFTCVVSFRKQEFAVQINYCDIIAVSAVMPKHEHAQTKSLLKLVVDNDNQERSV